MLRLKMLGGLSVSADDQPVTGAATQRRRLALLALIAGGGESGVSRDKLIAYLWPEGDAETTRHALTQSLYALRRDLRAPTLLDGSNTELRLNPAVISSDVADFQAALRSGDVERAVGFYGGHFLDGFYITDAPEFERWVDGERDQLAKLAEHALERLASEASARGQHRRAAEWWRRLATLDPLSSRVALALMQALAAAGDRAAALRHARVHEALLREELQLSPDAAVLALVELLRTDTTTRIPVAETPMLATVPRAPEGGKADGEPSHAASQADDVAAPERYRVEREIGRGRTTTVYLAHDLRHGRPVALKVMHREVAATLAVKRFMREVMLIARLRHPHILPLYDSGEASGALYYVTPYVEGGSLRARLTRDGALMLGTALGIAREMAEALDYAHRHNAIHRDVTPEHILLDDGHALIAGFGIARALNVAFEARLTEPGLVLGTPSYMSPEQTRATEPLDGRSDIYSAGCVLFEMLTGAAPAARSGAQESIPVAVREILTRALAPVPGDRFASAAELAKALAAVPVDASGDG